MVFVDLGFVRMYYMHAECNCLYLIYNGSNRNGKNTLAVSNSVTYDDVHKTEAKTVPHQTTETGELYAMSTKAVYQDTHNEPSMLYTYARVDLDTKRVRYIHT